MRNFTMTCPMSLPCGSKEKKFKGGSRDYEPFECNSNLADLGFFNGELSAKGTRIEVPYAPRNAVRGFPLIPTARVSGGKRWLLPLSKKQLLHLLP